MPPLLNVLLVAWTAAAAAWWLLALWVVWSRKRPAPHPDPLPAGRGEGILNQFPSPRLRGEGQGEGLTVFKPIPPRAIREAAAVETFIAQTDATTEVLLGIETEDEPVWQPVLNRWRAKYPHANFRAIVQPRPCQFLSPKVSWFHTLAAHARGELWMWSDADMLAPPDLLHAARTEFAAAGCGLLTFSYVVRRSDSAPALLETLFANVEMLPGILVCQRFGSVKFAMGAGMLFRAETFRQRIRWEDIGARIADDFVLGNTLTPVKVSDITLETLAAATTWRNAVQHYLRWKKTVRWLRPAGFAGLLLTLPVGGWLLAGHWAAALGVVLGESLCAWLLCAIVRSPIRHPWVLPVWAVLRPLAWLACWFRWPVVFHSQQRKWWSLYESEPLASPGGASVPASGATTVASPGGSAHLAETAGRTLRENI